VATTDNLYTKHIIGIATGLAKKTGLVLPEGVDIVGVDWHYYDARYDKSYTDPLARSFQAFKIHLEENGQVVTYGSWVFLELDQLPPMPVTNASSVLTERGRQLRKEYQDRKESESNTTEGTT
jgi:hypothetical protein